MELLLLLDISVKGLYKAVRLSEDLAWELLLELMHIFRFLNCRSELLLLHLVVSLNGRRVMDIYQVVLICIFHS